MSSRADWMPRPRHLQHHPKLSEVLVMSVAAAGANREMEHESPLEAVDFGRQVGLSSGRDELLKNGQESSS